MPNEYDKYLQPYIKSLHISLPPQTNKSMSTVIDNQIRKLIVDYQLKHFTIPNVIIMPEIFYLFLCNAYGEYGKKKKIRQIYGMKIIAVQGEIPMQVYKEISCYE